jgi:hypothetical protein
MCAGRRAASVPPRELRQHAARSGLDEVEHVLEFLRPAVVRVGHLAVPGQRCEIEQQREVRSWHRGPDARGIAPVALVHDEHEVEALEIARHELAGAQRRQVVAAARARRLGTAIGRVAHAVIVHTGGIDVYARPAAGGRHEAR